MKDHGLPVTIMLAILLDCVFTLIINILANLVASYLTPAFEGQKGSIAVALIVTFLISLPITLYISLLTLPIRFPRADQQPGKQLHYITGKLLTRTYLAAVVVAFFTQYLGFVFVGELVYRLDYWFVGPPKFSWDIRAWTLFGAIALLPAGLVAGLVRHWRWLPAVTVGAILGHMLFKQTFTISVDWDQFIYSQPIWGVILISLLTATGCLLGLWFMTGLPQSQY